MHYIEGCTAPIYTSDSLHSRGRRDHREEERPRAATRRSRTGRTTSSTWSPSGPGRARGRDDGVDRRQHRLQGHDEVPGGLPGRRARQGRGALGRLRRRGPAPGRRRQDGPRRAGHHVDRSSRSRSRGAAAAPATAAWSGSRTTPTTARATVQCDALLVDDDLALRHLPVRSTSATTTCRSATRPPSRRSADEQLFYLMSRGLPEDEAMAMIVSGFIEPIARELPMEYAVELQPPDRAADGRLGRLDDDARADRPRRCTRPSVRHSTHSDGRRRSRADPLRARPPRTTPPTSRAPTGREAGLDATRRWTASRGADRRRRSTQRRRRSPSRRPRPRRTVERATRPSRRRSAASVVTPEDRRRR